MKTWQLAWGPWENWNWKLQAASSKLTMARFILDLWIIRLGRTCILIGETTIVRLIIRLCINNDKQTDDPSRQVIWIIRLYRRTIWIARQDRWAVCLLLFIHRRIIRRTIVACPISVKVRPRQMIHLKYKSGQSILEHSTAKLQSSIPIKTSGLTVKRDLTYFQATYLLIYFNVGFYLLFFRQP